MNGERGLVVAHIPLLSAKDRETTALLVFRFEMRKTRLQFERIAEDREQLTTPMGPSVDQKDDFDGFAKLMADIHFLFVCLKKLRSLFLKMQGYFPADSSLKGIEDRYGRLLDYCGHIRNDLEHIEERAEDGIVCLGVTFGPFFQFDKKQIEIDTELREKVETFFKEVDSVYDQILIARRKESGERFVMLSSSITIPGGSETFQLKEDDQDRRS